MRKILNWLLPLGIVFVNASLGFCLYVASRIFEYSHILKTNLTMVAEAGFFVGVVGVLAAFAFSKAIGSLRRLHLLMVLTLFNQLCVTMFLVALLPFGGQVLVR
jgi:hypothetical protein